MFLIKRQPVLEHRGEPLAARLFGVLPNLKNNADHFRGVDFFTPPLFRPQPALSFRPTEPFEELVGVFALVPGDLAELLEELRFGELPVVSPVAITHLFEVFVAG